MHQRYLSAILGLGLMVFVGSCAGEPGTNHVASVDVEFDRATQIVERKIQLLAPESRPGSGPFDLHGYSERKETRKVDPVRVAEYSVSAVAHAPGGAKQPVQCHIILKKTATGVEVRCDGEAWEVSSFQPETYWSPDRFLEEVLEELPWKQSIQWGEPSNGLRLGVVLHPSMLKKYPRVRAYVQNVGSAPLEVCPRISTLLAKEISVGPQSKPVNTHSAYVTRAEYLGTDGKRFGAVMTGAFLASGLAYENREILAPNEILLWARNDLRLGDVETSDEQIVDDSLPVGTYRLAITLASKNYPGFGNNRPGIWEGSIQCMSEPFALNK